MLSSYMREEAASNKIIEYRRSHPHCNYCKYSKGTGDFAISSFECLARRKEYIFNRAKYCKMYEVDIEV